MSPAAANRESDGKSTVATATENSPCGSMYRRKAASIAAGARAGSSRFDANNVSTNALKLIRPRPIVTGSISTNTRFTAGSRQLTAARSRPSRPRSQGSGIRTWITVPTRIEPA